MTVKDVKVKDIDESAHYLYPNRTVEIKTSGKTIMTPTRAATSYEYHEKAKVPTDIVIRNPTFINIEKLNPKGFQKFITTNQYFSKLLKKMDLNNRLAQHSDLNLTLFQPTVTPQRDPTTYQKILDSPMHLLKQNQGLRERFIRFIIKLHEEAGAPTIAVPFIELPLSVFKEISVQISRSLERINYQPVFFVDLNYIDFESAIDFIANELQSQLIGLLFRPFRNVPQSYEALSKYVDKDVVFFSVHVSRYESLYNDISTMHYLPFFGNDIYAVKTPVPFGVNAREPQGERVAPIKDRLSYLRFFDRQSLQVTPLTSRQSVVDELIKEYEKDTVIKEILENYREARYDEEKYKVLNAFSKTSEVQSSFSEFERLQRYIKENSTKDYVEEKAILQKTLQGESSHSARFSTKRLKNWFNQD